MAVPPTVPTSFVPRSASSSSFKALGFDFGGAFAAVGYGALLLSVLMAGGVFGYGWILSQQEAAKRADLKKAEAAIDTATVESFIHLDTQLKQGKQMLDAHLIVSHIFDVIENVAPTTIRLDGLHVSFTDNHAGIISAAGTATTFNALAALSAAFGKDARIKNAIFSNITILKTSGVSFTFTANVDPKVVEFSSATPAPTGTTTPPSP